jgi:hypothetical protein
VGVEGEIGGMMEEVGMLANQESEAPRRGRPPGTNESLESLSKKIGQRFLKLVDKISQGLEEDLEKVGSQLKGMDASSPQFIQLSEYRAELAEKLVKSIAIVSKIATSDPGKAGEGEVNAGALELLSQLKGDG